MVSRKSAREIKIMREAGRIVAKTHALIESLIEPGVTTAFLDKQAENFIRSHQAIPIFKGYRGFPSSICTSINEEIVHGIPSDRKLQEGDILSVDIGVCYQNYVGDAAKTFAIGKISKDAENLLRVCQECLKLGIEAAQAGNKVSDISRSVQTHAEANHYNVVREYTGHGVGLEMHEEPQVPNYIDNFWLKYDMTLKPGHCIAIEPMLNIGTYRTKTVRRLGWDVVLTRDNKLSAHFEHTIAVAPEGPVILTLPD